MKRLDKIIKNRGYYKIIESSYVCCVAQEEMDKIFPDKKISVISYKNGILKIKTENNYLLSEIRLSQAKIIFEINKKSKTRKIKKINF